MSKRPQEQEHPSPSITDASPQVATDGGGDDKVTGGCQGAAISSNGCDTDIDSTDHDAKTNDDGCGPRSIKRQKLIEDTISKLSSSTTHSVGFEQQLQTLLYGKCNSDSSSNTSNGSSPNGDTDRHHHHPKKTNQENDDAGGSGKDDNGKNMNNESSTGRG